MAKSPTLLHSPPHITQRALDSIVSSSSTQGSETRKTGPTKRPSVSSNLPKPPRPKNMFDITDMSYEQYVDRYVT